MQRVFSRVLINTGWFHCLRKGSYIIGAFEKQLQHSFVISRHIHSSRPCLAIHSVNVPPFAESVSEGDIVWKVKVGDTVKLDDVIAEIETDKTNVPVPAPLAGVITELLVSDGDKVVGQQEICKLNDDASLTAASTQPSPEHPAKPVESAQPTPAPPPPPPPSVAQSPPSPPPAGDQLIRVIPPQSVARVPTAGGGSGVPDVRSEQRVKMSRMRQRIAQRLKDAQNTCAMLTTFNEIDMTNLFDLRKQYKDVFVKKHGVKLGMMSTFAKASAVALRDQPAVNAVIDDGHIIYRDYIDISIAVATPKGLVVPVLRHVERMNYLEIEREIVELGVKAREGKLAIEDMDGGTFTISNGGVYGSLFGTPIINPPQSAILGLYGVFDRPVARNGQVVIRPMMYVALTYDHRLIDGREAVTFLRKVKEFVEDPRTFFLQL